MVLLLMSGGGGQEAPPLDIVEPTRRSPRAATAIAVARSTEALLADSDEDSKYKAAASEDSESDEVFAAPKGKPNPGGTGKKLQRKGKVGNKKTATIQAKDPPPAKKAKTPRVCSSYLLISLLDIRIHNFL